MPHLDQEEQWEEEVSKHLDGEQGDKMEEDAASEASTSSQLKQEKTCDLGFTAYI
jgi:hypothetical protein